MASPYHSGLPCGNPFSGSAKCTFKMATPFFGLWLPRARREQDGGWHGVVAEIPTVPEGHELQEKDRETPGSAWERAGPWEGCVPPGGGWHGSPKAGFTYIPVFTDWC